MNKEVVNNVLNNYFYGIDFEKGKINSFKRFDNDKKDILKAYNESEWLDTFALIKSLYIEFYIFKCDLSNTKTEEDINKLYNDLIKRTSYALAIFTNDLLKKIGRSIDINGSSKMFRQFDSVGDCLIYIYKLCKSEFIDVSKGSSHIDEKELKKIVLHEYKKLVNDNFTPGSSEYNMALNQYQKMLSLINHLSLEEFAEIFKIAYSELLNEIEIKKKNNNVK